MDGLLLVDKPAGWTSHDAVGYVRRALGEKRVGHTGTLDPDATGLLILLVGKATRLARFFESDDKTYHAVMKLGTDTDTQDASGRVVKECIVPELDRAVVEAVFARFTGCLTQTPPVYSAIKVDGKPMYKRARAGETVELKPREITVHSLDMVSVDGPAVEFVTRCSKGTYVRTLCRDMAEALGSCGHMQSLRRTAAGCYNVNGALDLSVRPSGDDAAKLIVPMDEMLPDVASVTVTERGARGIRDGRPPLQEDVVSLTGDACAGGYMRLLDTTGVLLAVAEAGEDAGQTSRLLVVLAS